MDGILLLNKEKGITSFQAIDRIKKKFKLKKAGHAGTLDPSAEGLLITLINKGTKINDFIHGLSKEYVITIKFGAATDTDDTEGKIIKECPLPVNPESTIKALLPSFTGEITQKAPSFSAINKDGKKLYELARAGEKVDPPERQVTIHEIELLSVSADNAGLRVVCSTGTYMRSLARDIGEKAGSCAHLFSLKRTRIGEFTLDQSVKAGDIDSLENHVLDFNRALYSLPPVFLNDSQASLVKNGNTFRHESCTERGLVKLVHNDAVIAIASVWGGIIKIRRGLW